MRCSQSCEALCRAGDVRCWGRFGFAKRGSPLARNAIHGDVDGDEEEADVFQSRPCSHKSIVLLFPPKMQVLSFLESIHQLGDGDATQPAAPRPHFVLSRTWNMPDVARVLASTANYMICDDHEFTDDLGEERVQRRVERRKGHQAPAARKSDDFCWKSETDDRFGSVVFTCSPKSFSDLKIIIPHEHSNAQRSRSSAVQHLLLHVGAPLPVFCFSSSFFFA